MDKTAPVARLAEAGKYYPGFSLSALRTYARNTLLFMLSGLEVVFQGTAHLPYCGKSTRLAGVRSSDLSGSTAAPRRRRVIRQGHHQKSHLFFRSRLSVSLVGAARLKPAAALHQQSVNGESDGSLRFPDGALARFRCRSPHRCPLLLLSQVNKVLVGHGNFSLDTP